MMKNFRKQRRLMFSNHYTLRSFLLVSFFLPGACPQPLLCEPNHGRSPAGVIQHNFAGDGLQPDPRRDWRASLSTCTPNLSQTCALPPLVTSESGVIFLLSTTSRHGTLGTVCRQVSLFVLIRSPALSLLHISRFLNADNCVCPDVSCRKGCFCCTTIAWGCVSQHQFN